MTTVSWTGASQVHVMRVSSRSGRGPRRIRSRRALTSGGSDRPARHEDSDFAPLDDRTESRRVDRAQRCLTTFEASTLHRSDGDAIRADWSDPGASAPAAEGFRSPSRATTTSGEWRRRCWSRRSGCSLKIEMPLSSGAVTMLSQISSRAEVRGALPLWDAPYHEVPFTMAVDERIVRGTIDCLIASNETSPCWSSRPAGRVPSIRHRPRSTAPQRRRSSRPLPVRKPALYTSDPVA